MGNEMHNWRKGIASWRCGDTLYLGVPFTWLLDEAEAMAKAHNGPVVAGGPAVDLCGAEWAETPKECQFDTLSFHNPCATFTTRGCPNRCEFCAVPKIEGQFRQLDSWKPAPIVCDNNLLASTKGHFRRVIESLRPFKSVDFNQGLDARLFTPRHADLIATLDHAKVRFALDHINSVGIVMDAIATAKAHGLNDIGVYCLIGFKDTPEDARERLEAVRSMGIRPNPMRYQPLDATEKDAYVDPNWTDSELRRMMRYYSRLRWLEHIPYDDYNPADETLFAIR